MILLLLSELFVHRTEKCAKFVVKSPAEIHLLCCIAMCVTFHLVLCLLCSYSSMVYLLSSWLDWLSLLIHYPHQLNRWNNWGKIIIKSSCNNWMKSFRNGNHIFQGWCLVQNRLTVKSRYFWDFLKIVLTQSENTKCFENFATSLKSWYSKFFRWI